MANKIAAFIVGGILLFTLIGTINLGYIAQPAAFIGFVVLLIIAALIAYRAPSGAKAWRRLLIPAAIFCLLIPFSALVTVGQAVSQAGADSAQYHDAAQAGAAIGGSIGIMIVGFFAILGAAILLIVGLLVGRDKQVVYVYNTPESGQE